LLKADAVGCIAALKAFSDPSDSDASPQAFAPAPASWYYLGSKLEIAAGPRRFDLPDGQTYVAFRVPGQPVTVLGGRCSHMGADLSLGCVKSGRIVCPLHGWEYGSDGDCEHIPASPQIPAFARQPSFPVEECGGHVFFFNRPQARFPLPFFSGVCATDLLPARPFEFTVDAPWYLVSANGFDVQHFRCAHDRTLLGEPIVDSPHPFAWRLRAKFRVTGTSLRDRLTRKVSGSELEMTVENWCGNLVLVAARFRRTTSYGLVSFTPLNKNQTKLRNIVWVPRSKNPVARWLVDPLDAMIRRSFIREFVRSDVHRSAGIRFHPARMIGADNVLVEYLGWLQKIHR
jgi:phenylpropionate dioxygenase-like ring-hydroxylating dioxygenase large terminal subunit